MVTTYTSGKISHDPLPWKLTLNNGTTYRTAEQERLDYDYEPRPEFDNHNPILAAFRSEEMPIRYDDTMAAVAGWWLDEIDDPHDCGVPALDNATNEQRAHARRVFEKLAALA